MSDPVPCILVAMTITGSDIFERNFDSVEGPGSSEVELSALLALMYFLNDSFKVWMLRIRCIDEIIARIFGRLILLVSEVEGVFVVADKLLEAFIVDVIIEICVDSSFVV